MPGFTSRRPLFWLSTVLMVATMSEPTKASAQALYRITDLGTLPGASGSVAAALSGADTGWAAALTSRRALVVTS